jgi:hypothetical protein
MVTFLPPCWLNLLCNNNNKINLFVVIQKKKKQNKYNRSCDVNLTHRRKLGYMWCEATVYWQKKFLKTNKWERGNSRLGNLVPVYVAQTAYRFAHRAKCVQYCQTYYYYVINQLISGLAKLGTVAINKFWTLVSSCCHTFQNYPYV